MNFHNDEDSVRFLTEKSAFRSLVLLRLCKFETVQEERRQKRRLIGKVCGLMFLQFVSFFRTQTVANSQGATIALQSLAFKRNGLAGWRENANILQV